MYCLEGGAGGAHLVAKYRMSSYLVLKVWSVAVVGGNVLLVCGGVMGMVMGASVGVRVRVSLAVIACLSLSSAPLAHRFLDGEGGREEEGREREGGRGEEEGEGGGRERSAPLIA